MIAGENLKLRNILPLAALSLCVIVLGACSIPERGPGVPVGIGVPEGSGVPFSVSAVHPLMPVPVHV